MFRRTLLVSGLLTGSVTVATVVAPPVLAAKACRTTCRDTTAPSVSINAPAANATVAGTVAVTGSSSDNVAVASVAVAIDGGGWQPASGTTAWAFSWSTVALGNGTHTVAARSTDTSGNSTSVSRSVTVANPVPDTTAPTVTVASPTSGATVSGSVAVSGASSDNVSVASVAVAVDGGAWQQAAGTSSWSWTWNTTATTDGQHTVGVRATDTSGNATTQQVSVTVANATQVPPPPPPTSPAPATQGTWRSPEGVTITVQSAGPWTIAQIYSILTANALDLAKVGPGLTIDVQDQYASQTQTGATLYGGKYTNVTSTMWLQGVASAFASRPDDILTHEYGHAWSNYWYYTAHQASWAGVEGARWTTADGSLTLATDSRTGSSYSWQVTEIVADDYRLLFGSGPAVNERPTHLNSQIPDPRNVSGLGTYLLTSWRVP